MVDWHGGVFASYCRGSNCLLARAMDGRISPEAPLALTDQLPLLMIVKRGCKTRYIRISDFSFSLAKTVLEQKTRKSSKQPFPFPATHLYCSVGRYHRLCATVSTVKKYRGTR